MTTPDYKSIALRLYGYGKFAEDYGYRIENPEDLGIPWPPT
jgi:hypothetical protein